MAGKELQIVITFGAILLIQVVATALGNGLFFSSHEGDMLHLADLVLRQSGGEVYHRDIATPLGGWATLPMALLHRAGLGLGEAMTWGQIVASLNFFAAGLIVSVNRLTQGQSAVFALVVMGLATGLVHGGTEPLTSLAMHYNRWCWAGSLIITLAVLLPGRAPHSTVEGIAIGALMAGMAMIKLSFPVALTIPVIFGLLRNGRITTLLAAFGAAAAILLAVTAVEGIGYWQAYLRDILSVAGSPARAEPGEGWRSLVISPSGTPATLIVVALIYFAARSDRRDVGAMLLLFFAAFTFVTWQNYGNDPLWLCIPALVAWVLSTRGQGSAARGLRVTAVAAGVMILPVLFNILWSPVRHVTAPEAFSRPLFPDDPTLRMVTARGETAFAKTTVISAPGAATASFDGEPLGDCVLTGGLVAVMERDSDDLLALAPGIDRQPLVADLFQSHWIFAGLRPLPGGAPWYYDGLPGLAEATHVIIPDCPTDRRAKLRMIELLELSGLTLEPQGRTDAFRLYRIER